MKIFYGILSIVAIIAIAFTLELGGLKWSRFFEPKKENIKREVFENTKSYVHGKIQQLAKYHHEWTIADDKDRHAIEAIIRVQYADFDETKITAQNLKTFLTKVRGY